MFPWYEIIIFTEYHKIEKKHKILIKALCNICKIFIKN